MTLQLARIANALKEGFERDPAPTRRVNESDGDFFRRIRDWEKRQS